MKISKALLLLQEAGLFLKQIPFNKAGQIAGGNYVYAQLYAKNGQLYSKGVQLYDSMGKAVGAVFLYTT